MRKCFISFKKEDLSYKNYLVEQYGSSNFINKTLDRWIDSEDGDYIMQVIRQDYLCDSTVTLFLIGEHSSENEGYDCNGYDKNFFIKRELFVFAAIITKIIQMVLGNKFIKKNIFTKMFKHEVYTED